jgi:heat-inducible transcriptional repressor
MTNPPDSPLDDRKAAILRAIVEEYVDSAQPVGSQTIAASRDLGVSSATIRNDMTVLEREGYITQPHTSAGRIPTDQGYRYFVDHLSGGPGLGTAEKRAVSDFFGSAQRAMEEVLHETSQLLARITQHASMVVGPPADEVRIRNVQLVSLQPDLAIVVVVLSNGSVERGTIAVDPSATGDQFAIANQRLSEAWIGLPMGQLSEPRPVGDRVVDQVAIDSTNAMRLVAGTGGHESVFVGGASHVVAEVQAFTGPETVSRLLQLLERQYLVVSLVRDLIAQGASVRIGNENEMVELKECSLVIAPYRVEGELAGTLAVLGPTRMNYPQTMAAVSAVSRRLTKHLST